MQSIDGARVFPVSFFQQRNWIYVLVILALFAPVGRAQDPLQFFKNYFVTGDYVVAGVGLNGQGVNGFATNTINMTGVNGSPSVPCTNGQVGPAAALADCSTAGAIPAEPIAAFLIWQSLETTTSPSSASGWFGPTATTVSAITGSVVNSSTNTLGCWSNGGTNPNGILRVYLADVLRYLRYDPVKGVRLANDTFTVTLADSGGGG